MATVGGFLCFRFQVTTLLETVGNKKLGDSEIEDAKALPAELDWLPLAITAREKVRGRR